MKIIIKELKPEYWIIQSVSSIGVAAGRTGYLTAEAAKAAAEIQFPGVDIEIQK